MEIQEYTVLDGVLSPSSEAMIPATDEGFLRGDGAFEVLRSYGGPEVLELTDVDAAGINFLLDGATDRNGNLYEPLVQELTARGIEFRLCNFTLQSRNIDPSKVIAEAKIVPSGVAEVSRLQAKDGFAYLRP